MNILTDEERVEQLQARVKELEGALSVINEGDTVFKMAASRVENCRCSHESCDLCVLSRTIIRQVETQIKALAEVPDA